MSRPVIISCALTGSGRHHRRQPLCPDNPRADRSRGAGGPRRRRRHRACACPRSRRPGSRAATLSSIARSSHASGTRAEVLINLTTGLGARFQPDEADPNRNAIPGLASPEDRMAHVIELRPEICSLDVATMNFGKHAFVNTPDHIARMPARLARPGVKPELEIFDLGHAALARHLSGRACSRSRRSFSSASAYRGGRPRPPTPWWR